MGDWQGILPPIGGAAHSALYGSHAFRRFLASAGMAFGEMRCPGFERV